MHVGTSLRYIAEAHWGLAFTAFERARREAEADDHQQAKSQLMQTALSHAESARTLYHASGDELRAAALTCEIGLMLLSTGQLGEACTLLRGVLEQWQPLLAELVENTQQVIAAGKNAQMWSPPLHATWLELN
jgi:hypothetical protein